MGTINEKLNYLLQTKENIKQAIKGKGVEITDSDSFRSYAEKIGTIKAGEENVIESIKVNGVTQTIAVDKSVDITVPTVDVDKNYVDREVSSLKGDLVNIKDVTVVVKESKNLFNRNDEDYKPNTIYDTSGAETYNANNSTTGFIPCNVGDSFVVGFVNNLSATELTRQNVTFVYLYDSDRKFISRSTQFPFTNYVYTVSDTSAKFIRFSVSNTLVKKDYVMIAKSSGNLSYEPYYAP